MFCTSGTDGDCAAASQSAAALVQHLLTVPGLVKGLDSTLKQHLASPALLRQCLSALHHTALTASGRGTCAQLIWALANILQLAFHLASIGELKVYPLLTCTFLKLTIAQTGPA